MTKNKVMSGAKILATKVTPTNLKAPDWKRRVIASVSERPLYSPSIKPDKSSAKWATQNHQSKWEDSSNGMALNIQ